MGSPRVRYIAIDRCSDRVLVASHIVVVVHWFLASVASAPAFGIVVFEWAASSSEAGSPRKNKLFEGVNREHNFGLRMNSL